MDGEESQKSRHTDDSLSSPIVLAFLSYDVQNMMPCPVIGLESVVRCGKTLSS